MVDVHRRQQDPTVKGFGWLKMLLFASSVVRNPALSGALASAVRLPETNRVDDSLPVHSISILHLSRSLRDLGNRLHSLISLLHFITIWEYR